MNHRFLALLAAATICFVFLFDDVSAIAVTLAENGQARMAIVVSKDASAPTRHAADELKDFLEQVTGGTFDVVAAPVAGKPSILVGISAAGITEPLGSEEIVIRTVGDDLILAGGEPRGSLYAVYTFLENHVGCRWWTPTASTIPHRPTLTFDAIDIRYKPVLEARETDAFSAMDGDWSARNKYNGQFHHLRHEHGGKTTREPGPVHTFYTLINPGQYFEQHPEWFSLLNGKRSHISPNYPQASLCLSNQDMRRQLVENLKQSLRDAPSEADSCGLSEVRFNLADGKASIGNPGAENGWNTSGNIKVSASSEHSTRRGIKIIDGSGLDATGLLHGTDPDGTMFMTGTRRLSAAASPHPGAVGGQHWVAFEFDQAYPLGEMWIWNQNENVFHLQGMRSVTIRCSPTTGDDPSAAWTTVFEGEIPEAKGLPGQPRQIAVDFGGVEARTVVVTVHNSWAAAGTTFIAEVSQPDDSGPPDRCECDECRAIEKEDGPSGLLVRFLNAVAADLESEFPNVPISTLGYHYTQDPPLKTKPDPKLMIRLCDIHASFSVPLSHDRNYEFRDDLIGWSKVCRRLHIWDYVANFSYALNPHPNLRVLAPNIRYLIENGATGYFAEALMFSPNLENAELRSWVLAKLMWNPQLDGDALIEEFVNGYYGTAGDHVLAYVNLMHDAVEASGDYLGLSSPPDAKFLTLDNLCRGWKHLKAAEKAVGDNPELQLRVRIAQLPVMYVFLVRWDELRQQADAGKTPWPMPRTLEELHADIMAVARQGGMNLAGMPSPLPFQ